LTVKVRTLSSLGSLGYLGNAASLISALKTFHSHLSPDSNRDDYKPGDSLSGLEGLKTFTALHRLITAATDDAGTALAMLKSLANGVSAELGKAFGVATAPVQVAIKGIGLSIGKLDNNILGVSMGEALWAADQLSGKRYIQKFIEANTNEFIGFVDAYLAFLRGSASAGRESEPPAKDDAPPPVPLTPFQRAIQGKISVTTAPTQLAPKSITAPTLAPTRPSVKAPTIIIGASVAAAFLLLSR